MTFAVMRLPGKPIVLVKVEVPLENYTPNLRVTCAYLAHLLAETEEQLYIWIDLRETDLSFCDILIAADELNHIPVYRDDLRLAVIGHHPLIEVGVRRIQRQINMAIDHFVTLEEALSQSFPFNQRSAHAGYGYDG